MLGGWLLSGYIEKARWFRIKTIVLIWSGRQDPNLRHLAPKDESKIMHILFVISSQLFYKTTYF